VRRYGKQSLKEKVKGKKEPRTTKEDELGEPKRKKYEGEREFMSPL
jgi:hypothetical protein